MSLFEERLADLPLHVEGYALEGLTRDVSSAFTRVSTVIRMHGAGEEGVGEDVTYDAPDHEILQAAGPVLPFAGEWTLGSFCDHVEALDLWPAPPQREPSRLYRVWAYESTALDLALRQAGTSLYAALGRESRPVRFVVSLRLGEPPTLDPVTKRLERYPSLRFKLDPTTEWTPEIIAGLVATGAVDSVDFKGLYEGTIVDQPADPVLYRRVVEAFPDAWIEDPKLTEETDAILLPHRDRITWDAPIHGVADIEALPFPPRMVNVKPSRLGPLRSLFGAYEYCEARGIRMYGGGQFELGPGAATSSTSPRSFTPTRPTTWRPAATTTPTCRPGCRTARWRRWRTTPAFAGARPRLYVCRLTTCRSIDLSWRHGVPHAELLRPRDPRRRAAARLRDRAARRRALRRPGPPVDRHAVRAARACDRRGARGGRRAVRRRRPPAPRLHADPERPRASCRPRPSGSRTPRAR